MSAPSQLGRDPGHLPSLRVSVKIEQQNYEPVPVSTHIRDLLRMKPFEAVSGRKLYLAAIRQSTCAATTRPEVLHARRRAGTNGGHDSSTPSEFSGLLSLILDRPVIGKTGIPGSYDIRLAFSPDNLTSSRSVTDVPAAAADPNGPTVFTALQEQLGLRLLRAKGPVEVLVIDHVERPSEN